MKNLKSLFLVALIISMTALTGCLHIIEETTFNNNGSGTYKMTLDMSEMKGMMEMLKSMDGDSTAMNMGSDSTSIQGEGDYTPPQEAAAPQESPVTSMGDQISSVALILKGIEGITGIVEVKDTNTFNFGYSFNFADVAALNRALKIINKDKYQAKADEVYRFKGKSFERLNQGDIGAEMKKVLDESNAFDEEGAGMSMDMIKMFLADMITEEMKKSLEGESDTVGKDGEMDMVKLILADMIPEEMKKSLLGNSGIDGGKSETKDMSMLQMFFADMSYQQIYHFPDSMVKKSNNKLSEISDNGHTLAINLKPFDAEQQKKKASVATKVKLK